MNTPPLITTLPVGTSTNDPKRAETLKPRDVVYWSNLPDVSPPTSVPILGESVVSSADAALAWRLLSKVSNLISVWQFTALSSVLLIPMNGLGLRASVEIAAKLFLQRVG